MTIILTMAPSGQRHELEEGETLLGRAETCGIRIDGRLFPQVSGRHLRIERAGAEVMIEDLDSTNGTFVDGERLVGRVLVRPGMVVSLGRPRRAAAKIASFSFALELVDRSTQGFAEMAATFGARGERSIALPTAEPAPSAVAGLFARGLEPRSDASDVRSHSSLDPARRRRRLEEEHERDLRALGAIVRYRGIELEHCDAARRAAGDRERALRLREERAQLERDLEARRRASSREREHMSTRREELAAGRAELLSAVAALEGREKRRADYFLDLSNRDAVALTRLLAIVTSSASRHPSDPDDFLAGREEGMQVLRELMSGWSIDRREVEANIAGAASAADERAKLEGALRERDLALHDLDLGRDELERQFENDRGQCNAGIRRIEAELESIEDFAGRVDLEIGRAALTAEHPEVRALAGHRIAQQSFRRLKESEAREEG